MTTENKIITVYAEATPNPSVLKFVVNMDLGGGEVYDFENAADTEGAPLAEKLFEFEYVSAIFIMNNFVSVTKKEEHEWVALIPEIRDVIKEFLSNGGEIVTEELKISKKASVPANESSKSDTDDVSKIKQILNDHVKPAVEMDGGAIDFVSFKEGIVTLQLKGACSGCPSSIITLKAGIEGLLKRVIPGVKEVVAESV